MRSFRSSFAALGPAALLVIGVAGTSFAQSGWTDPAGSPAPSPTASGPAVGASPAATPVGPITWSINEKGKDFKKDPAVSQVVQLPDGRLLVVGRTDDPAGRSTAAAWDSADGTKWARTKIAAPKGSLLTAVASLGDSTIVAVGGARDGTGLTWTSADGSTWAAGKPMGGTIYDLAATGSGLVGAGVEAGAATVWLTTDGVTWRPRTLAPSGRALHVAVGGDGLIVVAGAVTDADGNDAAPTVWTSADGATWTTTTLATPAPDLSSVWSVPAMALAPAGYVLALAQIGTSGVIGRIWSSPDGLTWAETLVDDAGSFSAVGTAGTDALVIGHGQVLRSSDGVTWTPTDDPSFEGWSVRDVITLADGRFLAAGDTLVGDTGSAMAVWIGEAAAAPSATPVPTAFDSGVPGLALPVRSLVGPLRRRCSLSPCPESAPDAAGTGA